MLVAGDLKGRISDTNSGWGAGFRVETLFHAPQAESKNQLCVIRENFEKKSKKTRDSQFTQNLEIGVVPCFAKNLLPKSRGVSPLTDARKREVEIR